MCYPGTNNPAQKHTKISFDIFNKNKLYSTNIWIFSKFNSNFSEPLMKFPSKLRCFILTDLNAITLSLLLARLCSIYLYVLHQIYISMFVLSFQILCSSTTHRFMLSMKNLIMKIFINTENMLCLRIKWHITIIIYRMERSQWAW